MKKSDITFLESIHKLLCDADKILKPKVPHLFNLTSELNSLIDREKEKKKAKKENSKAFPLGIDLMCRAHLPYSWQVIDCGNDIEVVVINKKA